jgi:hypothetical protein
MIKNSSIADLSASQFVTVCSFDYQPAVVHNLIFANKDTTTARTIALQVTDSLGVVTKLLPEVSIAAKGAYSTAISLGKIFLEKGDILEAQAGTASKIDVFVSYDLINGTPSTL